MLANFPTFVHPLLHPFIPSSSFLSVLLVHLLPSPNRHCPLVSFINFIGNRSIPLE
ncbi:hypothetical protein F511_20591 [Dorcoceras hygrometricum]|uniref:Uncharacterized protein n=1 Tax=Dorcoceras hygrometricum TaxID=472368 RepID=A0A2Z7CTN3_9LAMI|nr:hypothetical protein F511_20591 [Dorcoceras hygrometricum]